jgi:anti-sigma regulatory factor (Ser/Thr protein kinase)
MTRRRTFKHEPESVTAARRFATQTLRDESPAVVEVVELLVSELATNCVRHTRTGFELVISRRAAEVLVEATDHSGGAPRMRSPGPTEPSGRGLRIIDMLSTAWGVEQRAGHGKTVWFTVGAEPTKAAAR